MAQAGEITVPVRTSGRPLDEADIERRFTHHVPLDQQVRETHDAVREAYKEFAHRLAEVLPDGREKAVAFTELEASSFWAHAAVAREGK